MRMRITVRLFAILKDRAGTGELTLDLPEGSTISAAGEALREKFPALRELDHRLAYALNCEHASRETRLRDGDELALIPPVSGG